MIENVVYYALLKGDMTMKENGSVVWRVVFSLFLVVDIVVGVLQLVRDKPAAQADLYELVGKIAIQEQDGAFPLDAVFLAEADAALKSLAVGDQVRFLVWAVRRYPASPSVTESVVSLARRLGVEHLLDYHLTVLRDNAKDEQVVNLCQAIRDRLKEK